MRFHRSLLTIVLISGTALLAREAFAKSPPPATDQDAWSAQYGEARAAMLAGNFAAAADKFAALAETAPDAPSRFLAVEMMSACRTWANGGFVLTRPRSGQPGPPALLEDRRTTDEISILYTSAVLYGLYAGVVADIWSKASSPGSAIPPPLLLAGTSAGVVALLDHTVRLRYGVAQSIVSGLYIGIEEGIAWALWHEASSPYTNEWGEKAVTSLILATGTVGAVAGGIVGTLHGTTPGRASLMGSAAMWSGAVAGLFMGGMTESDDTGMLSAAVMLNAGAVAGVLAGARVSPSIARVRFIDLGGLSGGLLVGGLYWAARDRDAGPRGVLTATSLGMTAGLVTSWLLTRNMETDEPRRGRALGFVERLLPTIAPTANGAGLLVGVASAISKFSSGAHVGQTRRVVRFSASILVCLAWLAADVIAAERPPWPARQRRTDEGLLRPGVHALKNPQRWPAEPESPPTPIDPERFRKAFAGMCEGMAGPKLLGRIAAEILQVAAEANVDPFLLGALVYRESRCVPTLRTGFGTGLLQIQTRMIQGNVRAGNLRYQVKEDGEWKERTRSIPAGALLRLQNSLFNLRLGAAMLAMWQDQHPAIDEAFPGSVPHRSAVAHFGWGDIVRGTGGEDRALIARRRMINRYLGKQVEPRPTDLGFAVVSPLEGIPRLATSGPGEDRDEGGRAHRGLDLDATSGEPVGSIADGVVSFAGFDLPGRVPPQIVPPDELLTMKRPPLGPGGLFVCIRHVPHVFSCYMHLQSYRVAVGDRVQAGQIIGNVGRSGTKSSGTHLHLEIHRDGQAIDPAPVLGADFAIPPEESVAHDIAVANQKHRLAKERRARWKARLAEKEGKRP